MKRIGLVLLVMVIGLVVPGPVLAQDPEVSVHVGAYPAQVVPAGGVVFFVPGMFLPLDETVTIVAISSELYGDVADSANPALRETTCVVPSVRQPGEYTGALDWACGYRVWVQGDPGEVTDTVTVTVVRADGREVMAAATVSVTISIDAGAIRGTLTDSETGAAVANTWVHAMPWGGGGQSGSGPSDPTGFFDIQALVPGEYLLMAGNSMHWPSEYAREWWDDSPDQATASPVMVVGGEVTTVDWALSLGGVVEGTVSDAVTGAPIGGISVSWVGINQAGDREGPMGSFSTDADGLYRISGLYAADYLICFYDFGSVYARECWNDRTDFGDGVAGLPGDPIRVEVQTVVSGIDAALAPLYPPTTHSGPTETLPFTGLPATIALPGLLALLVGGATLALPRTARRRNR